MKKKTIFLIILILILLLLIISAHGNTDDDSVIYIPNFLNNVDYQKILLLNNDKSGFIFENFRYSKPLSGPTVYDIFYSNKYIDQIKHNLNTEVYPSKFPIEHRYYPKNSPGMRWHKDLLMYEKPQYEGIFTIRNNTKSLTEWIDGNGKLHSLWTEPNSLLIVKANGYEHHVTPPEEGEREILKLIYTQTDQVNENYKKEMKRFKNEY